MSTGTFNSAAYRVGYVDKSGLPGAGTGGGALGLRAGCDLPGMGSVCGSPMSLRFSQLLPCL